MYSDLAVTRESTLSFSCGRDSKTGRGVEKLYGREKGRL